MTYKKNVLKKYKFLLIVPVVILLHLLVKRSGIEGPDKGIALIAIWGFGVGIFLHWWGANFSSVYMQNSQDRSNVEFDIEPFQELAKKIIQLNKSGKDTVASIIKVRLVRVGVGSLNPDYYLIKYSYFSKKGDELIGLKGLYNSLYNFIPSIPKVGDKIKIFYDESNPNISTIAHEKADKAKWYWLQKKYKINIIKSN